ESTYHNIGFCCVDKFLEKKNIRLSKTKYFGMFCEEVIDGEKVVFVKPTTYMNNSGTCVKTFVNKFKASIDDILIIYDDYDLPIGQARFRKSGSSGTHNGMRDIVSMLGTENFKRLRIGIKDTNNKMPLINYVLSRCDNKKFDEVFEKTNAFLEEFISKKGNVENVSL
ncbi:MAG: aminoacyl-tRNA hydrolase, partial [Christensenellales bacterium]